MASRSADAGFGRGRMKIKSVPFFKSSRLTATAAEDMLKKLLKIDVICKKRTND